MNSQTAHLEITVIILDDIEKDARQQVKVLPHITLKELLASAVETFADQLPQDSAAYVWVDQHQPRVPLDEDWTLAEVNAQEITRLIIRRLQDIPRKIPCLIFENQYGNKKYFPLREGMTTLGRALPDLTIDIDWDQTVSRNSAEIVNKQGELFIKRTKAKRFMLNNQRCPEDQPMLLSPGDEIVIGETRFILGKAYEDVI